MTGSSTSRFGATLIGAALLVSACSSDPSIGAVEEHFEARVQQESSGRLRLVGFKKTNGQTGEVFGVPVYSLDYEMEIEVVEPSFWEQDPLLGETTFKAVAAREMNIYYQMKGYQPVQRGERITVTGSVQFERTEQGWKGPRGKIY